MSPTDGTEAVLLQNGLGATSGVRPFFLQKLPQFSKWIVCPFVIKLPNSKVKLGRQTTDGFVPSKRQKFQSELYLPLKNREAESRRENYGEANSPLLRQSSRQETI